MDLSLRAIVHSRYHMAGGFSVKHDVLSKLDPKINYRTADGKVSLRLILTPPLKPKISSFSAKATGPGGTNPVTFAWQVEEPAPWLKGNTFVTILARINANDPKPYWSDDVGENGNGLIGMTSQSINPAPYTYSCELAAYVKVQGGTDGITTPTVFVLINQPSEPGPGQAATLTGTYTVTYSQTTPPDIMLTLSGIGPSVPGAAGQSSFNTTIPRQLPPAGGVLFPPEVQTILFDIPNLQIGIWTVTAVLVIDSGVVSSLQCSNVKVPGNLNINPNNDTSPCQ